MKYLLIVSIIFFSTQVLPQDLSSTKLDSLYHLFTYVKGVSTSEEIRLRIENNPEIIKCGLGLVNSIKQNLNYFTPEQQIVLSKLLLRPTAQKSVVSPNGFFRVHYDTTGNNTIGYDLTLFLEALDSVYNFEINYLGYPTPPPDEAEGGDDKYDIYIQSMGDYGLTYPETRQIQSRWTSYMLIDNDFGSGFYTHGIDAARVTLAHEFHHAIQMGNYAPIDDVNPFRESDRYFYELTSTAMEEFVFDNVNDYYAYMPTYFNYPDNSLVTYVGYDLAIWNIYLQKNFGFDIFKNQWERIPTTSAIKSVALSFIDYETILGNELNRFGIWCYYTGNRNIFPGEYFEEADEYPLLTPTANVNFNSFSQVYNMTLNPTSNYFFNINLVPTSEIFLSLITNADWQKALDDHTQFLDFSFAVYNDSSSGNKAISENYSITFNRENQQHWNNAGILNNEVVYGDTSYNIPELENETFAYPTPYKMSSSGNIRFAFLSDLNKGNEVNLNVYSSGLQLVYSGKPIIRSSYLKNSKKYCEVILDGSEINFATGVYIYVIKSGNEIWKGKLVIFND